MNIILCGLFGVLIGVFGFLLLIISITSWPALLLLAVIGAFVGVIHYKRRRENEDKGNQSKQLQMLKFIKKQGA